MVLNPSAIDMIISTDASRKCWGGGEFSGPKDGWSMAEGRRCPHQCVGIEVSSPCHSGICQGHHASTPYSGAYGQFHGSVLHKQARGTHSPTRTYLALEIWNFCISRQIWITARHVPGVTNTEADFASRNFNNRMEWTLNK